MLLGGKGDERPEDVGVEEQPVALDAADEEVDARERRWERGGTFGREEEDMVEGCVVCKFVSEVERGGGGGCGEGGVVSGKAVGSIADWVWGNGR